MRAFAIATLAAFCSCVTALAEERSCPSYDSSQCVNSIKQAIEEASYLKAARRARLQCSALDHKDPAPGLATSSLITTAIGCHYLYSIEEFLGHPLRAWEAHKKGVRISHWGCSQGISDLCELLVATRKEEIRDLLAELAHHFESGDLRETSVELGDISVPAGLPEQFEAFVQRRLQESSAISPGTSSERASHRLDLTVSLSGPEMSLAAKLTNTERHREIWNKTFFTGKKRASLRHFGFDIPDEPAPRHYMKHPDYEPYHKVLVGLGVARLPNSAGSNLASTRGNLQIRSVEEFHQGRTEFGILASLHATMDSLVPKDGDETNTSSTRSSQNHDSNEEESPKKYNHSLHIYGMLSRLWMDLPKAYDGIRNGLHLGGGGVLSETYWAPTVRLGWDIYFGRRYVVSFAAVGVGKPVFNSGRQELDDKRLLGSTATLSLNL